jgi:hypothetical protein
MVIVSEYQPIENGIIPDILKFFEAAGKVNR